MARLKKKRADPEMKGIYRIDSGTTHAWHVCRTRNGKLYAKRFSDLKYGGREKAKALAIIYRNQLNKELDAIPKGTPKRRVVASTANNKTGEMGVSRIIKTGPNGTKHECYLAHWSSKEEGQRSASFAVPKYGEEKAFKMAVAHRRKMMREILGQTEYRKYLKEMRGKKAEGPPSSSPPSSPSKL